MNMFKIVVHHGLRRVFCRALRDAIFLKDIDDVAKVSDFILNDKGKRFASFEDAVLYAPEWVFRRVRRYVPPPDQLLPRVAEVFKTYGPLKDSKTGEPLFNQASLIRQASSFTFSSARTKRVSIFTNVSVEQTVSKVASIRISFSGLQHGMPHHGLLLLFFEIMF